MKRGGTESYANRDLWWELLDIVQGLEGHGVVVKIQYVKKVEKFVDGATAEGSLGEPDVEHFSARKEEMVRDEELPSAGSGSETQMEERSKEEGMSFHSGDGGTSDTSYAGAVDDCESVANTAVSDISANGT
jgi:hypothetical protein